MISTHRAPFVVPVLLERTMASSPMTWRTFGHGLLHVRCP